MSDASVSLGLPVADLRRQFPGLQRDERFIFFDNAAGAQIPSRVLEAITGHLVSRNVQRGGVYRHSREVDAMLAGTRESVAALVNARGPDEIAFGLNATSFIRATSLAIGQTLGGRNEIVVTDLDHEANVATWLALERSGARITWWPVRNDGRLHVDDLEAIVTERTRLVACTMASNATGTRVDVGAAAAAAHRVGAEIFVDAVHLAPHAPRSDRARFYGNRGVRARVVSGSARCDRAGARLDGARHPPRGGSWETCADRIVHDRPSRVFSTGGGARGSRRRRAKRPHVR